MPRYITQQSEALLPDGSQWRFKVKSAQERESQAGNPIIQLCLQILNKVGEGQVGVGESQVVSDLDDIITFTPKASFRIDQFRLATGDKLVPGEEVNLEAEDCVGRCGEVVLKIDNFQGRPRNKVDFYVTDQVRSNKTATTAPGVGKSEFGEPSNIHF